MQFSIFSRVPFIVTSILCNLSYLGALVFFDENNYRNASDENNYRNIMYWKIFIQVYTAVSMINCSVL